MWNLVSRGVGSPLLRGVLRTIAAAAAAGIGWKLGTDAYEAVKKRIQKRQSGDKEKAKEDGSAEEGGEVAAPENGESAS